MTTAIRNRDDVVRLGRRLEYFAIAYNSLEGLIAFAAGLAAGSVSLVGFGLDSLIEMASAVTLLWRLHHDRNVSRREQAERATMRIVGWCFIGLAVYVAYESIATLLRREAPERSLPGIVLAACSVIVMPLLARAKRRVAAGMGSAAMRADSRQADFCAYLSAILLAGLLLNAWRGWWWADPLAALAMTPIVAKEGFDSIKGKQCSCACHGG
jgi:divalent metal cation (Fe/Co/Zn/Cd) transporter